MTPPPCHNFKFKWIECIKAGFVVKPESKNKICGRYLPEVEVS